MGTASILCIICIARLFDTYTGKHASSPARSSPESGGSKTVIALILPKLTNITTTNVSSMNRRLIIRRIPSIRTILVIPIIMRITVTLPTILAIVIILVALKILVRVSD